MLERAKPGRKAALETMLAESMETCLVDPFVQMAASGRGAASAALAQAWITTTSSLTEAELLDEAGLIEIGIMVCLQVLRILLSTMDFQGMGVSLPMGLIEIGDGSLHHHATPWIWVAGSRSSLRREDAGFLDIGVMMSLHALHPGSRLKIEYSGHDIKF